MVSDSVRDRDAGLQGRRATRYAAEETPRTEGLGEATARDLAQKNVEAEQQKYELGGVTAFEVLDAQSRLASVEGSLLQAYVDYRKAVVSYERAVWTLLDGMGIIVETPKVK